MRRKMQGLSIKVHPSLAGRQLEYEAQDHESFVAFADRLAREHDATFPIKGQRAGFVPRNQGVAATCQPLPTISGSVTIEGDPTSEPEGIPVIQLRRGVDGSYTIASITDTLDRGSGYTTQISLGNPQGSAGADSR